MPKYLVNVAIADLRREPVHPKLSYERDLLQESQLLFNEPVLAIKEQGDWLFVEAIQQQKYTPETGWKGYPGWLLKEQLVPVDSFPANNFVVTDNWNVIYREPFSDSEVVTQVCLGTSLHSLEKTGSWHLLRLPDGSQGAIHASTIADPSILDTALRMRSHPYLWGGRSFFNPSIHTQLTGCDCSGLVSLAYSVHGIQLPRDAHDQFLHCRPVTVSEMAVGDLIFLEEVTKPGRKSHVMLFAGGDAFFDTNMTDQKAVYTTSTERFGIPFAAMEQGQNIGKYLVSFGSTQS